MKQIVVFGGTGKRGSGLCRKLLEKGSKVICLDDDSVGWFSNLGEFMEHPNLVFIKRKVEYCEITDFPEHIDLIYNYLPENLSREAQQFITKLAQKNQCKVCRKLIKKQGKDITR